MRQPDLFSRFIPLHEMLQWGRRELEEAEIPTARLDAEVLLGAVLGLSRAQVLARAHSQMRRHERGNFVALIQRRKRGEPVAYILGQREFYGRDFFVDRRVLIPRPETEELVDRALDFLDEVAGAEGDTGKEPPVAARVADIGTGSGAIAVTLAAERSMLEVVATDSSAGALDVARQNAARHDVAGRIDFREGSLLEPLVGLPPLNLIVANLPYVGTREKELLAPDIVAFEPHEALFAGEEGLDLFPPLFRQLREHPVLLPGGALLLEIGYAQGTALARLARSYFPEARIVRVHKDMARLDRFVELRP